MKAQESALLILPEPRSSGATCDPSTRRLEDLKTLIALSQEMVQGPEGDTLHRTATRERLGLKGQETHS